MEKQFNQENALSHENKEMQMKETDLQKSEQKYRRIFEDSNEGLILWDDQHCITDINYAGERMIGISKEKLIGHRIYNLDIFQDVKKQEIVNHIDQVFNNGKCTSTFIIDYEDGRKKYFEYSSKLNIVEGLNFTVFKDVTEKVAMQEQLRKSDTLTVIGELAAGIAHEIRNPMTALKGFIQLLEGSITKDHSMYYQVITTELQRIDSIINEFLILAKPQAIRFQEKDINQIMKETVDLLTAQAVLYNVQFVTEYNEQLPAIYCEPNQLKKVFINLIKNAIEVMPGGGKITISVKKAVNKRIIITIEDEGSGIPEEMIKRLGEPFYTTKDRGTGLGLMVSYRIIDEHKGTIKVKSEEGKGTIFQITLPFDGSNSIN
ncbi:Sporulation kinase E [Neobacillus rhizosphaerae]|uniref:histidine kinase n=1 Tax=Neobacillus rhizosphaerae TaxID=2880965 RepID=A0ABM9EV65_9BACI|nr:ATP-binding protein [Neobacillus rhizosphaerae]CAH2716546.1 Sporulation kinase E [Neobacillus rhizosphaerae]